MPNLSICFLRYSQYAPGSIRVKFPENISGEIMEGMHPRFRGNS